jgi:hypothetical protein
MSTIECLNCGSTVPGTSSFCPECGRPLRPAPGPVRGRLWPAEWGLAVIVLFAAGGIALLAAQVWAWGVVLLLVATVVFLAERELTRRRAGSAFGAVRARLAAHRDLVSARSRGQLDLFRLRRDLAELQAERGRGFHDLGQATYMGDVSGVKGSRAHLDELSERVAVKEAEIEALVREVQERVQRVQAQVAPTQRLEAAEVPTRIPEPYPPPDEGTPPEPARIPEPGPAPEPAPDEPPPDPQRPPPPETRRRPRSGARLG